MSEATPAGSRAKRTTVGPATGAPTTACPPVAAPLAAPNASGNAAPKKERIAVIGAGMMGQGCSQAFAMAGYEVRLQSLDDELFRGVRDRIRADLLFLAERGVGLAEEVERTASLVSTTTDLAEAVDGADFVLECIFEDLEAKRALFRQLEALVAPDVILATNTSAIRISEIAQACTVPGRVIGAHWWNPAYLIPIVEIIPGEKTAQDTVGRTTRLLGEAGKLPVYVKKDAPGFVGNRLLHALYREAMSIVEQGIADPDTVDLVLKYGPGMRFQVMAPFEHMDMVGLDLGIAVESYLWPHLADSHEVSPMLLDKVAKGELGFKSGGVGFRTWTAEEQKAFRESLLDHLAKQVAAGATVVGECGSPPAGPSPLKS
jgi:3-hydroxybutyryl-CoA dehydrogenase